MTRKQLRHTVSKQRSALLLALALLAALLAGCGQAAETSETRTAEATASLQTATPAPAVSATPAPTPTPAASAEPTEPAIPLSEAAGLWVMQEVEVEGDRLSGELAGLSVELLVREEGTADYIELTAAGESTEHINLLVDGDGDGRLDFSYGGPDSRCVCVIVSVEGDALELSSEWLYPDGTPGGSTMFFTRWELDARGRTLYAAELEQLTDSLDYRENGFFVCTYDRPEEIDWHEVCYSGAGIGAELTEDVIAAYEAQYEEYFLSLEAIPTKALEQFVWDKTQTSYSEARKPLWADEHWEYLSDLDLWCWQHGDTNAQPIVFTEGYANGCEYYLYYTRDDYENYVWERPFVMHCYIRDGEWQYISNLPADAPAPVTLLTIDYFETREEAGQRGVTSLLEIETRPYDEPYGWCWAVVTAQEDGVRYTVDRTADSLAYEIDGAFIPGENLSSGMLNAGECFAIYTNQPWHPSVMLTATKDAYWGQYAFGEDNWLHFENSVRRYVTGHDLQGEGRGCYPETEEQLARFLMDGTWVWLDEGTGGALATVRFDGYRQLWLTGAYETYPIFCTYDRLYASADEAPDLIRLSRTDYSTDWSALPRWLITDELGDYLVSAVQLDGEQILYLTQANNGDGALGWLLPGADGNDTAFLLHRWRGTTVFESQGVG